jgi:hypothetical protein
LPFPHDTDQTRVPPADAHSYHPLPRAPPPFLSLDSSQKFAAPEHDSSQTSPGRARIPRRTGPWPWRNWGSRPRWRWRRSGSPSTRTRPPTSGRASGPGSHGTPRPSSSRPPRYRASYSPHRSAFGVSLGDGFRLDLLAVSLDLGVTARFRRGARGTGYLRCCCGSSVRFCELVESADNKLLMQKKKRGYKGGCGLRHIYARVAQFMGLAYKTFQLLSCNRRLMKIQYFGRTRKRYSTNCATRQMSS